MKRMWKAISVWTICLVACAVVCLTLGCVRKAKQEVEINIEETPSVRYEVDVTLLLKENKLVGEETIYYTVPFEGCESIGLWSQANIVSAHIEDSELHREQGDVYTFLMLPSALSKGEKVAIQVQFAAECKETEKGLSATDYIPLVSEYIGEYLCPTPSEYGEYRAVERGEVDMRLIAPKQLVIAANGEMKTREYEGETQTLRLAFSANEHIALAASPYYIRKSATVGETTWEYYATTVDQLKWQSIQAIAQNAYALWGDCNAKRVCLIEGCDIDIAGLAGIRGRTIAEIKEKVAAQWGKMTGEAWIAASIEEYVKWVYDEQYDNETADKRLNEAKDNVTIYTLVHKGEDQRMDRPIDTYDKEGYDALLVDKGLLFWVNLHEIAGDVVGDCVHTLASINHVDTSTLLAVLKEITGKDYTYFVVAWVEGKAVYAR